MKKPLIEKLCYSGGVFGRVAQWIEQLPSKQSVAGSSPAALVLSTDRGVSRFHCMNKLTTRAWSSPFVTSFFRFTPCQL